jgi:hypothetical protein
MQRGEFQMKPSGQTLAILAQWPLRNALLAGVFVSCQLMSMSSDVHAADRIISKSTWLEAMKTVLPNAFCAESEYFRKCFKVTQDQCIQEAVRATKTCITALSDDVPAELHQPDEGTAWGKKLGLCAGQGYETSLIKSKLESSECKDPSDQH